jgi:hypothetical protein
MWYLEHFYKTKEYNDVSWLHLSSLDKVKVSNELRDSISHVQMCIKNLKGSKCALKENLLSCSYETEGAQNPYHVMDWIKMQV